LESYSCGMEHVPARVCHGRQNAQAPMHVLVHAHIHTHTCTGVHGITWARARHRATALRMAQRRLTARQGTARHARHSAIADCECCGRFGGGGPDRPPRRLRTLGGIGLRRGRLCTRPNTPRLHSSRHACA
jgi:hypothetical protein